MKIHILKSTENGQYHWHAKAKNGRIIAATGETYKGIGQCVRMIKKLFADRFLVVMPKEE